MSIGRIMLKSVAMLKNTKIFKSAVKTSEKVLPKATPSAVKPSIVSRVESNTSGRMLRMLEAKQAFTPYQTTVTKESVPTLQKIEEITGVSRGKVADATGYFDKKRAADALAAFKHEPIQVKVGNYRPNYQPTGKVLEDMHNLKKIEALKKYEQTGKLSDLPKDVAQKRLDANIALRGDLNAITPREEAVFYARLGEHQKTMDAFLKKEFAKIDAKFKLVR